jgi:hypothetical protein
MPRYRAFLADHMLLGELTIEIQAVREEDAEILARRVAERLGMDFLYMEKLPKT